MYLGRVPRRGPRWSEGVGDGALVGLTSLRCLCVISGGLIHPHDRVDLVLTTALEAARRDIGRDLALADPDRVTAAQAAELVLMFARVERLCAAGKVLFSDRAAQSTTWRDEGHRSPASWMAEKTGTGVGDALNALETSSALASLPETSDALKRGELSHSQLTIIAGAAADNPTSERELLRAAADHSLKALKERAAQVRAAASSAEQENARYRAIHKARHVRHWVDPDGAFRLDARLTPDAGARFLSALKEEADVRFDAARQAQQEEPPAAYLADALVALVSGEPAGDASEDTTATGSSRANGPRGTVVIRVDAQALRRGYAKAGETCVIPGVGPVPVAAARRQLSDAFVKILVLDGKDIVTVCHAGRNVSAYVQSALEERDPVCVVPRCDVAFGLENHHWPEDYCVSKKTGLGELARVCGFHHDLITIENWKLTRREDGSWQWREPPGGASFETGKPFRPRHELKFR